MSGQRFAAIGLVDALAAEGRLTWAKAQRCVEGDPGGARLLDVVEELQVLGFPILTNDEFLVWNPGHGHLRADAIEDGVRVRHQECAIQVVPLTDSTNSRLLADASAGDRGPRVLLAECQLAGRGRRQRQWQALFGEGILMSLLVDTGRATAELPGLAIAAGAALAGALADMGVGEVSVKWPNDIQLNGSKVAGLLVEAPGGRSAQGLAVIGVGLNWAPSAISRAAIGQPVAGIADALMPSMRDRNTVAAGVIAALLAMVDRFRLDGLKPFLEDFAEFDALRGREVRLMADERIFEGVALGIADDGSLRVMREGVERRYHSAELSVRAA